jgi:hypothetical protein
MLLHMGTMPVALAVWGPAPGCHSRESGSFLLSAKRLSEDLQSNRMALRNRRSTWSFFEGLALLGWRVWRLCRTIEFAIGTIISVQYDFWIDSYANAHSTWLNSRA